jgi:biopolymer transport protein ExbD
MAYATPPIDRHPLGDINTTPLIDVMLVLLIMFVITIPAATHSLEMPLPSDREGPPPKEILQRNRIVVTAGDRLLWNGADIGTSELSALLAASARMPVEPELQFAPDGSASYGMSAEVLQLIKRSGVSAFGFVGNENFAAFGAPPKR